MKQNQTFTGKIFDMLNYFVLFIFAALTLLPLIYVISGSLTTVEELAVKKVVLIPTRINFAAYEMILSTPIIPRSLLISVFVTVVGTGINIIVTSLMAYPLAKKYLPGRSVILRLVVFTMLFNGGMIPTYMVVYSLGMIDKYMALWLPVAVSPFNLILMKNFFQQIPESIEESATIDGCSDVQTLFRIVLPLSKPSLAAFSLFYAVGHWNSFFNALLYINNTQKWPVQVWLRQIVILSQGGFADPNMDPDVLLNIPPESLKLAVIVVATVPILMVYPFLQKHFAKGVLLGSVKG